MTKENIQDGTAFTRSHWCNLTSKKNIVLVDFDHTITTKCLACADKLNGDSVQMLAKEALTELAKDYEIWIFTGNYSYLGSNTPIMRTTEAIRKFLTKHGIPFDKILQIKPPAAFIIDDRAVHHTSWDTTLNEIRRRENL